MFGFCAGIWQNWAMLDLKPDGRQSEVAAAVQRGTARLLRELGFAVLPEFTLRSGRRADLMAVNAEGRIWIIEIKSCFIDFQVDRKWPDYGDYCDRFFFAVPESFNHDVLPGHAGLIMADQWGAEILREPEEFVLHASRRKAVTLQFGRVAAQRLHGLYDP
jgi:hypothetical protein